MVPFVLQEGVYKEEVYALLKYIAAGNFIDQFFLKGFTSTWNDSPLR